MTEAQVRRLLREGVLAYSAAPRWIEPATVRALLSTEDDLGAEALDAILTGEVKAPRPARRYGPPQPIFPYLLAHLVNDAVLVHHSCGGRCGDCPRIGERFSDSHGSPWA